MANYQHPQQSMTPDQARAEHAPRPISEEQHRVGDLRETVMEAVRILSLRRWVFVVPFCLATTGAFITSQYLPRTYTASVIFERTDDPVLREFPQGKGAGAFEYFRRSLPRDIKTADAMGPIVTTLGLDKDLPRDADGELTAEGLEMRGHRGEALAATVSVEWWERSLHADTVELKYRGPDPLVGAPLVEEMRKTYIRLAHAKLHDTLTDTKEFFESLAAEQLARVEQIDRELTQFKLENPGVDPTDPDTIVYQRTMLQARLEDLHDEQESLTTELGVRNDFLVATVPVSAIQANQPLLAAAPLAPMTPEAQRLENKLRAVSQQISELQIGRGMTERHPDIIELRQMEQRFIKMLADQPYGDELAGSSNRAIVATGDLVGPVADGMNAGRLRTRMELVALQQRLNKNRATVQVTERSLARYDEMQANIFLNRRTFQARAEKLEDARSEYLEHKGQAMALARRLTVEEMDKGVGFASIKPAQANLIPITPASKTILIMTLLVGMATGMVCVVLTEMFDRRFRTIEQVTRSLGISILECIDEIVTAAERRRRFLKRMLLVPAAGVALIGMTLISGSLAYMSLEAPDAYRKVKQIPQTLLGWANLGTSNEDSRRAESSKGDVETPSTEIEPVVEPPLEDRRFAYPIDGGASQVYSDAGNTDSMKATDYGKNR